MLPAGVLINSSIICSGGGNLNPGCGSASDRVGCVGCFKVRRPAAADVPRFLMAFKADGIRECLAVVGSVDAPALSMALDNALNMICFSF